MHVYKYTCTSKCVHMQQKKSTRLYQENTRYNVHVCTCVYVCVGMCGQPKRLAESGREEGKVIQYCFRERKWEKKPFFRDIK